MEAYEKAFEERFDQKKEIQALLQKRLKDGINDMDHIQWLMMEEDKLAGTIAGLSHNYLFDHTKPVLALSKGDNGKLKVSSRGHRALCTDGLDLGEVMREAGKAHGGGGGGHDVAAGGSLLEEDLESYLAHCDRMVGEQLRGKRKDA